VTCVLFCVGSYWGCGQYISSLRGMSVVVWGLTFQAMSKLPPSCPGKVFYLRHLSRDWEGKTGKRAYSPWHWKVIGHLWQVWAIRVNKWTIKKFRQTIRNSWLLLFYTFTHVLNTCLWSGRSSCLVMLLVLNVLYLAVIVRLFFLPCFKQTLQYTASPSGLVSKQRQQS